MSDIYDPIIDRLDQANRNIIDVETEQHETNKLLLDILEELKKLNRALAPAGTSSFIIMGSGYTCTVCGTWFSIPGPHNCTRIGQFT